MSRYHILTSLQRIFNTRLKNYRSLFSAVTSEHFIKNCVIISVVAAKMWYLKKMCGFYWATLCIECMLLCCWLWFMVFTDLVIRCCQSLLDMAVSVCLLVSSILYVLLNLNLDLLCLLTSAILLQLCWYLLGFCTKQCICIFHTEWRLVCTVWVKKIPPEVFWHFSPNGWEFLINFLHTLVVALNMA